MKFIVSLLLIALLSFCACLYFPWWSIALVTLLVSALIPQPPVKAFATAFIALFALWTLMAYGISANNHHILARKLSLLILSGNNPVALILLTGAIGALVAGFAALAGSYLRKN